LGELSLVLLGKGTVLALDDGDAGVEGSYLFDLQLELPLHFEDYLLFLCEIAQIVGLGEGELLGKVGVLGLETVYCGLAL